MSTYEVVIVGAGPAGLSAATTARFLRLSCLVIDPGPFGGALAKSYAWKHVDGVLGMPELTGREIARKFFDHALVEGAQFMKTAMTCLSLADDGIEITTPQGKVKGTSVILAMGCTGSPRLLGVPGEDLEGVQYGLTDPAKYKGKKVFVIGGGDSAVETALALQQAGATIQLVHRKDELRAGDANKEKLQKSPVKTVWNTEVKQVIGPERVQKVVLYNNKTNETTHVPVDSIFISIGTVPNEELLALCNIALKECNIRVDPDLRTNLKGIFAAGDATGNMKRIAWAVGEGCKAAFSAYKYLKNPYWA